jgi:hypothetical protein
MDREHTMPVLITSVTLAVLSKQALKARRGAAVRT